MPCIQVNWEQETRTESLMYLLLLLAMFARLENFGYFLLGFSDATFIPSKQL